MVGVRPQLSVVDGGPEAVDDSLAVGAGEPSVELLARGRSLAAAAVSARTKSVLPGVICATPVSQTRRSARTSPDEWSGMRSSGTYPSMTASATVEALDGHQR